MKAGCVHKQQESQFIPKGRQKLEESLELAHQLVLLNWRATDLVRDSVSKNMVESAEDIQLCRLCHALEHVHMHTYILMSTHTREYIHPHAHHTPNTDCELGVRGMPVIPALWRMRQKDYDF